MIGTNEDFWALGMTAMRGYYITFDIANDKLGFAPQNDSSKTAIVNDPATSSTETPLVLPGSSTTTTTTTTTGSTLPTWAIITISVCSGVIAIVVTVVSIIYGTSAVRAEEKDRAAIRCSMLDDCPESKETAIQTLAASIGNSLDTYVMSLLAETYEQLVDLAIT